MDSFYGTNDQGGNVWEWHDAVVSGSSRGMRGGSWNNFGSGDYLASSSRVHAVPFARAASGRCFLLDHFAVNEDGFGFEFAQFVAELRGGLPAFDGF